MKYIYSKNTTLKYYSSKKTLNKTLQDILSVPGYFIKLFICLKKVIKRPVYFGIHIEKELISKQIKTI